MQTFDLSTLRGAQQPRLQFLPPKRRSSAGPAAVALAEVAGLRLDPWQQWCVEQILGETEELYWNDILQCYMHRSSAYESAIILARQNGKGAVLEAVELAWLFILGVETTIHSAHEFATSREHFQRIEGLVSNTPELMAEVGRGGIKWSHGDESITLVKREGAPQPQRLLFKTRTRGAARGFSPDKIVFDEAMVLKAQAVAAMKYATSARPDAQLIYTGSASSTENRMAGESAHFGRARSRGIKGIDPRLFFAEWSADVCSNLCPRDCDAHDRPGDPTAWAKANPGIGYRIDPETVQSEYLGDPREVFLCERLSVGDWPVDEDGWLIITEAEWMNVYDGLSRVVGPPTFSIATTRDKKSSCIAVVGENGEGYTHIEVTAREGVLDHRPGVDWVVKRAVDISSRFRNAQWVIDKSTQAGVFADELEKAGLKVLYPTLREHAQACGDFFASIMPIGGSDPSVRHTNQSTLRKAVSGVEKKDSADLWKWDPDNSFADITPLIAVTNAFWGYRKRVNKPKPKPMAMWG